MSAPRVAVLISGSGSNLQALIDASHTPDYPATIALVVSDKQDAYGLTRAKDAGIETMVHSKDGFESREAYDEALHALLVEHQVNIVCLAGFMRILSSTFVEKWHGKMLNIHPSLLPDYKGLNTHKRALQDGATKSGCTVHFVTAELDDGPIILQAEVPVLADDTEETLKARVLEQEHVIYPKALKWLTEGALRIDDGKAIIKQ